MSVDTAELIIRALSGHHLHGFLPGNDRRAAISRLVASKHHWSGPDCWCAVTREGIGDWRGLDFGARVKERRSEAVSFITWDELLAVIERGCAGGHREAYEAAYRAWFAALDKAREGWSPREDWFPATPDPSDMHTTTAALIRHGCQPREVQGELFSLDVAGAA